MKNALTPYRWKKVCMRNYLPFCRVASELSAGSFQSLQCGGRGTSSPSKIVIESRHTRTKPRVLHKNVITTKTLAQTRTPLPKVRSLKPVARGDSRHGTGFTSKAVWRARTRSFRGSLQSCTGFSKRCDEKHKRTAMKCRQDPFRRAPNPNPRRAQNPGSEIAIRIVRDDRRLAEPLQPS